MVSEPPVMHLLAAHRLSRRSRWELERGLTRSNPLLEIEAIDRRGNEIRPEAAVVTRRHEGQYREVAALDMGRQVQAIFEQVANDVGHFVGTRRMIEIHHEAQDLFVHPARA